LFPKLKILETAGVGESFDFGFWILDFFFKDQNSKFKDHKKMKCENLQFNLPLYADDILTSEEREQIEAHLPACPLCRARLAEYRDLQNDFRIVARPEASADLLYSVRNAVAVELNRSQRKPAFLFTENLREWLIFRVMPYSVGVFASLILTFSFLMALLSTREATEKSMEFARINSNRAMLATNSGGNLEFDDFSDADYPELIPIAAKSPRLNPTGALVALTKSIVRGKMEDEDVVVVADVFGDGIARIAEVVEAPRDRKAMRDLEKALNEDDASAPFVTAKQDNRSNHVRVVLKIQRVDVIDKTPHQKTKSRSF
jgi:hypothetical protein